MGDCWVDLFQSQNSKDKWYGDCSVCRSGREEDQPSHLNIQCFESERRMSRKESSMFLPSSISRRAVSNDSRPNFGQPKFVPQTDNYSALFEITPSKKASTRFAKTLQIRITFSISHVAIHQLISRSKALPCHVYAFNRTKPLIRTYQPLSGSFSVVSGTLTNKCLQNTPEISPSNPRNVICWCPFSHQSGNLSST